MCKQFSVRLWMDKFIKPENHRPGWPPYLSRAAKGLANTDCKLPALCLKNVWVVAHDCTMWEALLL